MKQTAVEWLVNMLEMQGTITPLDINQAKAMEKEQIIEAYLKNHLQGCWMKNTPEEYAEQYYKQTYESNT